MDSMVLSLPRLSSIWKYCSRPLPPSICLSRLMVSMLRRMPCGDCAASSIASSSRLA